MLGTALGAPVAVAGLGDTSPLRPAGSVLLEKPSEGNCMTAVGSDPLDEPVLADAGGAPGAGGGGAGAGFAAGGEAGAAELMVVELSFLTWRRANTGRS